MRKIWIVDFFSVVTVATMVVNMLIGLPVAFLYLPTGLAVATAVGGALAGLKRGMWLWWLGIAFINFLIAIGLDFPFVLSLMK